jgi:hypothetical protein
MYICFSCEDKQKVQMLKSRFKSLGLTAETRENTYVEYEGEDPQRKAGDLYRLWQERKLPGCYLESYDLD